MNGGGACGLCFYVVLLPHFETFYSVLRCWFFIMLSVCHGDHLYPCGHGDHFYPCHRWCVAAAFLQSLVSSSLFLFLVFLVLIVSVKTVRLIMTVVVV